MRCPSSRNRAPRWWLAALVLLISGLLLGWPARGLAHPTPASLVFLSFTPSSVQAELSLPIEELERGMGRILYEPPFDSLVTRHQSAIKAYLLAHLQPTQRGTAKRWQVALTKLALQPDEIAPRLIASLVLSPPSGGSDAAVDFHYDVISHEVRSHYSYVYVRSDWNAGQLAGPPRLVGTIHFDQKQLIIPRARGSFWRGCFAMLRIGVEHIATGTDHLLFLLVLVLPIPVLAQRQRWSQSRSVRSSLKAVLKLVSAFTVGHSLTLLLGAWAVLRIPTQPVEVLIALSILIGCAHAARPLFPSREPYVAALFGLVHGMAFAGTLLEHQLGPTPSLYALLFFNLGIELFQLLLLACVLPGLLLLAKSARYKAFRLGAVGLIAILASGWLLERTTTPIPGAAASVVIGALRKTEALTMPLLLLLFVLTPLGLALWQLRQARTSQSSSGPEDVGHAAVSSSSLIRV